MLIPIAAVVGFAVWAAARSAPPVVTVEVNELLIRFGLKDAVLGLRREFRIPLASIKGVAVAPVRSVPRTGLRLPGASIPGVLRAGSYGVVPNRDFWMLRRAETVLVIELEAGEPYRRIVLEVPEPQGLAHALRPKVGAYTGTFS